MTASSDEPTPAAANRGPETVPGPDSDPEAEAETETETDAEASAPQVDAIHCPSGHPNPPDAATCRICATTITDSTVTEIDRPVLGRLANAAGDDLDLDRPILIGRQPPETATIAGEDARIVTIADADTALSRSHAEIRLTGWDVQVVDLGSTNHTYVTLPDEDPVQLRPDEPFTIPVGTVVSLGVAVRLTYEPAR